MMSWLKRHPYIATSLGFLLLMILIAVVEGIRYDGSDPEVTGRRIGTIWIVSMVVIAVVRFFRKPKREV